MKLKRKEKCGKTIRDNLCQDNNCLGNVGTKEMAVKELEDKKNLSINRDSCSSGT